MTDIALHPTPDRRAVLVEHIRTVALRLRAPGILAGAFGLLATIVVATEIVRANAVIAFEPHHLVLPGMVGLLLPIVVWKGEDRFGPGYLWTLPVDRRRNALARVLAGWVWLMAMVAVFIFWLLGLALLSGANIGGEEMIRVLSTSLPAHVVDQADVATVRWTPEPWLWFVPVAAATAAYLLASAFALGTRHPSRWLIGIVLAMVVIASVGEIADMEALAQAPAELTDALFRGGWGIDMLLTAQTESLQTEVLLSSGGRAAVWRGITPGFGEWARATLLWLALGAVGLWAAAWRHREMRPR